jgi:hypothetical protein
VLRVVVLALACSACADQKGPPIHLVVARAATSDGRCFPGNMSDPLVPASGVSHVRISVRKHGKDDLSGSFLCDRVLKVPGDQPNVTLHVAGQQSIDVYAEAFNQVVDGDSPTVGNFRRVAVGSLLGVPLKSKTIPTVRMYPVEKFRCVDARMSEARAFHTATLLPNGKVLIIGGATASVSDPTQETLTAPLLALTGDAELYDPSTGTFTKISESTPPAGRAFHQAALIDRSPTQYKILIVGGVKTTAPMMPALGPTNSGVGGPRLVPFDTTQTIPAALPTRAAGAEILTLDLATNSATREPLPSIQPAAFAAEAPFPDGLAVAGGIDWTDPLDTTTYVQQIAADRAGDVRSGMTQAPRLGATLTPITDDVALLWGGGTLPSTPVSELVTGLGAGHTIASTSVGVPGAPLTQFHTATIFDTTNGASLLVTGGFSVENGGNAVQPPPASSAVRLVTVAPGGAISTAAATLGNGFVSDSSTCTNDMRYRPAGFESAIPLGRGRVLVTGGSPTFVARGCNDCDGDGSLLCSIHQAALFTPPSTLSRAPEGMQVARAGHTTTLLADGNVLVLGGLSSPVGGGMVRVSADAEVYDPRTGVPPFDVTDPAGRDLDDPLLTDFDGLSIVRAPGGLAHAAATPNKPYKRCDDF